MFDKGVIMHRVKPYLLYAKCKLLMGMLPSFTSVDGLALRLLFFEKTITHWRGFEA